MQIYLDRRGKRWPTRTMFAGALVILIIWFPLKAIGRYFKADKIDTTTQLGDLISQSWNGVFEGTNADLTLLDMYASGLTLVDQQGTFYYGSTYLALITLPIPRDWWSDKPVLNQVLIDISTPQRPMAVNGMVLTFVGELYANFWYLGVFLGAYLLASFTARFYFSAYRSRYFSVRRLFYLMTAAALIQVYRDGLNSLVVFPVVQMMPLMLMVLLNFFFPAPEVKLARFRKRYPMLDFTKFRPIFTGSDPATIAKAAG